MPSSTDAGLPWMVVERAYMPPLLSGGALRGGGGARAASPRRTACSPTPRQATVRGPTVEVSARRPVAMSTCRPVASFPPGPRADAWGSMRTVPHAGAAHGHTHRLDLAD